MPRFQVSQGDKIQFQAELTFFCIFFSGKPLGFVNVFTAFGVGLLGVVISLGLFTMEKVTTRYRFFKKLFKYNYRISEEPKMIESEEPITAMTEG